MAGEGFTGDLLESYTFDLGRSSGETLLHQRGGNAGRLEDLGAAVAADNGDAHLGHDLEEAALECLLVVQKRSGVIGLDRALFDHLADGLEGQIRIDRAAAVADEAGELMNVAGLSRLADNAGTHPLADAAEVMMDGADGQQGGDGEVVSVDTLVAENQNPRAFVNGLFGSLAEGVDGRGKSSRSRRGFPKCGKGSRLVLAADCADGFKLLVKENRGVDRDLRGVLGSLGEKIAPPTQSGEERHDQALADRVDRGIGNLGEELAEIGVKKSRTQ